MRIFQGHETQTSHNRRDHKQAKKKSDKKAGKKYFFGRFHELPSLNTSNTYDGSTVIEKISSNTTMPYIERVRIGLALFLLFFLY